MRCRGRVVASVPLAACDTGLIETGPNDAARCPTCGRLTSEHNRHVRFLLPEPVLNLPEREQTPGAWLSHADPNTSVMMQVPGVGPFCRCLVPIHLDGGYTLHFGVWVAIHPDDLQRAFAVWWTPDYEQLEIDGYLANDLPGWGGLAAPVHAVVRHTDHTPYVVASSDDSLSEVLRTMWPHDEALSRLPT